MRHPSPFFAVPLLALAACMPGFGEQGSGVAASETRSVASFSRVSVRGSADVSVTVGEPQSVTVSCDDNLISRVETTVEDGELEIGMQRGAYRFVNGLKVTIVAPRITAAEIRGSGDVVVKGLDEPEFDATIRGSGDVRASGKSRRVRVDIAGSGEAHLAELAASTARVSIAGSGDVEVAAADELSVEIRGSGDVRYRGDPQVMRSIAGSGDVTRMR